MSNSAADAINYSDVDDKVMSEAEEANDISVASSNDSDDNSNDCPNNNNDRVTEEAVFLCDAPDIQNQTSRSFFWASSSMMIYWGMPSAWA